MSSLKRDDDGDKKKPSDSPWADAEQQQDETLRLQQEVIAAAQQLERQSHGLAFRENRLPLQLETARPKFELATLRPRDDRFSLQEYRHSVWTPALDPVPMPPPPQDKISLASPGIIVGLVGAVGLAAAIALAIVHTLDIRPASPVMSVSAESEPIKSKSFASIADNLPRMATPEVKLQPAQLAAAATASVLAALPPNDAAVAKPSITPPPPPPTVEAVAKVEPAPPEPAKPAAPSVIPDPRPADNLSRDEIVSLLKRGQDMIATGDIASGRLFLTRAALAGDAQASLALAGTYDAAILTNLKAVGVQPDAAKARAWYTRAAEQGSEEAKTRLQQSALR